MKQLLTKFKGGAALLAAGVLVTGAVLMGWQPHSKVGAVPANTNVSYFLKIDGITGESTDKKHMGEIELDSYAWSKDGPGLEQGEASTGAGGGAGKVKVHGIHFTTKINKSSPQLMQATASGKHFKEAILTARKAGKGQQEFMTIKLSDIMISSYQTSGHDQGIPTDEFSLNFAKVEFSYSPQKPDGSLDTPVVGMWDIKENKAL